MEIIMRMINGLLTTTFVLILVWFIYSLVIRLKKIILMGYFFQRLKKFIVLI